MSATRPATSNLRSSEGLRRAEPANVNASAPKSRLSAPTTGTRIGLVVDNWKRLVSSGLALGGAFALLPNRYKWVGAAIAAAVAWVASGRLFPAKSNAVATSSASSASPSPAVASTSWGEKAVIETLRERATSRLYPQTYAQQLKDLVSFKILLLKSGFYDVLSCINALCTEFSGELKLDDLTDAAQAAVRPSRLKEHKGGEDAAKDPELVSLAKEAHLEAFKMIAAAASKKDGVSMQKFFDEVVGDKKNIPTDFFQEIGRIAKMYKVDTSKF